MPRTSLSVNESTNAPRLFRRYSNATGQLVQSGEDNPVVSDVQKSRSTTNTPGYRSLKRRREGLPMNPFSYSELVRHYQYGMSYQRSMDPNGDTYVWHGKIPQGAVEHNCQIVLDAASADRQALAKSLGQLKGMRVNLGVVFGERKRTADLIYSTAGKVANALRGLRRGNISQISQALGLTDRKVTRTLGKKASGRVLSPSSKTFASEWLALQYGWKPLLSDVYKSAEGLAAMSDERRVRVSASHTVKGFKRIPYTCNQVPYLALHRASYTRKYVYIFSHSSEILSDLSAWGVTNPASVAWELLPWSFVFDWFVPFGEYIDTWDSTLGLSFQKGCTTSFLKKSVQAKANGTVLNGGILYGAIMTASTSQVSCERSPLNDFPSAYFPSFQPYLTTSREISAVALLRQRLKL